MGGGDTPLDGIPIRTKLSRRLETRVSKELVRAPHSSLTRPAHLSPRAGRRPLQSPRPLSLSSPPESSSPGSPAVVSHSGGTAPGTGRWLQRRWRSRSWPGCRTGSRGWRAGAAVCALCRPHRHLPRGPGAGRSPPPPPPPLPPPPPQTRSGQGWAG